MVARPLPIPGVSKKATLGKELGLSKPFMECSPMTRIAIDAYQDYMTKRIQLEEAEINMQDALSHVPKDCLGVYVDVTDAMNEYTERYIYALQSKYARKDDEWRQIIADGISKDLLPKERWRKE